jgi:lysine-N-methylase
MRQDVTLEAMPNPQQAIEPRYFERFRCIGADCEDTCCDGWGILIDRRTYEKYRDFPDPDTRASLETVVMINPGGAGFQDHAMIRLSGTRCPALSDGLCSIQEKFGEAYISDLCDVFPRVRNRIDCVLENSLHLSCPEAARLVLLDPFSMVFEEKECGAGLRRPETISQIETSHLISFQATRAAVIELLRDRSRPLWRRLEVLACAMEELNGRAGDGDAQAAIARAKESSAASSGDAPQTALRLEVIIELILARISSEFTARRFLRCYGEFMEGLGWKADWSMGQIAESYSAADSQYFQPFMRQHAHLLENYLLNYVFRTMFPFGHKRPDQTWSIDYVENGVRMNYILLIVHYAIIKAVLTGMAGFYRSAFGAGHIVTLVQAATKVFQHSAAYPSTVMEILAAKGMDNPQGMALLARD